MKLSRLFPLLALLLAASLHAENTHKEVRIASPWPGAKYHYCHAGVRR